MKPTKVRTRPTECSVLELSAKTARAFLLKPESYCSLDLPTYFDFHPVLHRVTEFLAATPLRDLHLNPRIHEGVNYTVYSNKDGRYAWRPFQLIHPVIYVDLVNQLTESDAWTAVKERFALFAKDRRIRCLSIPQVSLTKRKDKGAQILHWWQGIEQASIELALDFSHVLHADIADCYASIYTHSIAWALHGKEEAKKNRKSKSFVGNVIDGCMQSMRHGQTNGISQGSVLMDLIAEMVLGYADTLLSERLHKAGIDDFQILRYRDDYRIFVNDSHAGEAILRLLTEVLIDLGLKLNATKTTGAQSVVLGCIKNDKRAWMRSRQRDGNLQKHLLLIHSHATEYVNAGSLVNALNGFCERIDREETVQNPIQLVSIAVDIGYGSPRCFPVCAAIVSRLLGFLQDREEKLGTVRRIRRRLAQLPNNGHLEVWLQRISYPFDPTIEYQEGLCRLVEGRSTALWNSSWITQPDLRERTNPESIVNRAKLQSLRPIVPFSEFETIFQY